LSHEGNTPDIMAGWDDVFTQNRKAVSWHLFR
jgi:hypothetical protein